MRNNGCVALLLISASLTQTLAQKSTTREQSSKQSARKIPCKTEENAAMCYWTRGRLAFYNGNPSMRLWKIGTKRILGIYSGPNSERVNSLDNENPEFPANLDHAYDENYKWQVKAKARGEIPIAGVPDPVFADFEVCALEPQHHGWMQSACIESAENIFVQRGAFYPRFGQGGVH